MSKLEEDLSGEVFSYAQDFYCSAFFPQRSSDLRRFLQTIMASFKIEAEKFEDTAFPESQMNAKRHEEYLQSVAVLEILGNIILCPSKVIDMICAHCGQISVDTKPTIASRWALKVVQKIEMHENDEQPVFTFGVYDPNLRDFITNVHH